MRDLVITGGGAAGFAAALYALDKRLDVLAMAKVKDDERLREEQ